MQPRPDEVAQAANAGLSAEDRARGDFYALLARLFADAPDQPLIDALAAASPMDPGTRLGESWNRLVADSAGLDLADATQDYTDLFVGVGRSELNLHASHWIAGSMMTKPLVRLRSDLAALGLARRPGSAMTEDHLSALCETMRLLIGGAHDQPPRPIAEQRAFFERHVAPWAPSCCAAIREHASANYYARIAAFAEAYLLLEREALALG